MKEQVNSFDDGSDILLRAGTAHSGLTCGIRELSGEVQSDHQNGKLREHCRNLFGHINAIQIGHLVVKNDKVRRPLQDFV